MALFPSFPGPSGLASTTAVRKALTGLVVSNTDASPRTGLFLSSTSLPVSARADMNVDIARFWAAANQFGGAILLCNDGTVQLPSPLVSPISGSNFYVVYAKQNESELPGTDANNNTIVGAVRSSSSFTAARSTGTRLDGSGTGLPSGAVELATVEIPTGKTGTNQSGVIISNTSQFTAAAGGMVPVRDQAQQDAWTTAVRGQLIYRLDQNRAYMWNDTAWMQFAGSYTVTLSTFGSNWSASATYPPYIRATGNRRDLYGVAVRGAGGAMTNILTIPSGHRPAANTFLAAGVNTSQQVYHPRVTTAGVVLADSEYSAASAAGSYPLSGSWYVD